VLPSLLFVDYIIMILFGGLTCIMGFSEEFYCGPYCVVGKILIALSGLLFVILISPDIAELIKKKKNVETTEK